jgi:hypothetical protein
VPLLSLRGARGATKQSPAEFARPADRRLPLTGCYRDPAILAAGGRSASPMSNGNLIPLAIFLAGTVVCAGSLLVGVAMGGVAGFLLNCVGIGLCGFAIERLAAERPAS